MRILLNPKLLFFVNTLPISILLFIQWSDFNIIQSLLNEESIFLWKLFGGILAALAICTTGYAIYRIVQKKQIGIIYCIASLILYTSYIYMYYQNTDKLISWEIPTWMLSQNLLFYAGSFIMLTLIHSLICLVFLLTQNTEVKLFNVWMNMGYAIMMPALFYILTVIIIPLWKFEDFGGHIFAILAILVIAATLFFILRFVYLLIILRNLTNKYKYLWKCILGLVFPLLGLFLNSFVFDNVFGDFGSISFFLIAAINGILLCFPDWENPKLRLFLFFGKSVTLVYILYFFFVMLPFTPFSVLLILFLGLGFLMLTPLLLLPVQINHLYLDFKYLNKKFNRANLYAIMFAGFLVLPIFTTISYKNDKRTFHHALDFLYSPDFDKNYSLNKQSILKTLNTIEGSSRNAFRYNSTPFLNDYYKWLVLDNLSVSNEKKKQMNSLFKGTNENHTWNDGMRNFFKKDTKIEYIECTSRYDREQNAWISQIELNIENLSNSSDVGYTTEFELPEGCWISDYYLYVGDVKEKGILAEKKAATWVFNQIVDFKRDPGLLKYKPGNRIDFRVYPFLEREVRKTGIEFIHKEPLTINIDDFEVELGDSSIPIFSDTESENAVYISVDRKSKLPLIKRKPYYHFIVDISENSSSFSTIKKSDFIIERISSVLSKNPIDKENAKITYTNTYLKTENFEQNNWKEKIKGQKYSGGFFLDRALKKIIYDAYQNPEKDSYPVLVVVSDAIRKAVYFNDLANLQFAYPESDMFYSLSGDSLIAYKFTEGLNNPITTDSIKQMNVRLWKTKDNRSIYLPDNNKPSVVLNSNEKISNLKHGEVKEKNWNTGLEMQAQWMMQNLYPYSADKEWLTLIQNSFKSGIMTPLTSYIVVENKAQKAILKKKQDEALSGKRALDLNDNTERMSEPNIIIVLVLFAIFYWCHHRKKRKNTYHK